MQPGPRLSRLGSSEQGVWGLGPQGRGSTCHPPPCAVGCGCPGPRLGSLPVLLGPSPALRTPQEEPAHSTSPLWLQAQGAHPGALSRFLGLRTTQAALGKTVPNAGQAAGLACSVGGQGFQQPVARKGPTQEWETVDFSYL